GLGTDLTDYNGLGARRPVVAAVLAVFLLALAGIPGTVGFIAKYSVFYAAFQAGYPELTIIGVIASMIGFYYYLRVIWVMYFIAPAQSADEPSEQGIVAGTVSAGRSGASSGIATLSTSKVVATTRPLAIGAVIGLALALIGTVVLGIIPGPLFDLARQAAGLP
ncbi:MAG TPA: proton-conducting transporter membrane subunit, partial [Ktedonobacterales bacterium]|nr:proton-conducting transporter membrane subunit [Ktedonobacterales bacterium]